MLAVPEIAPATAGGLTDITEVTLVVPQAFVLVYTMVSAPVDTPVTVAMPPPVLTTVALLLVALQPPPGTASDKVIADERHTSVAPEMELAGANTFNAFETADVHHELVAVYLMVALP